MDRSSVISLILVLVSLAASLVVFGALRERGSRALPAGCAAILAGLAVIFLFVTFQILQVLL
jgi:hypothetical protein